MAVDFTQNPYNDDYAESKDFYRLLFRPGYAVQARELTQLQTSLQKQVDRFGSHIFKNGSMVLGGQTSIETAQVHYLKLETLNASNVTIDTANFVGKMIVDPATDGTAIRAYVSAVHDGSDGNPPTLMLKYLTSTHFTAAAAIQTEDAVYTATVFATTPAGNGSVCSINEGVYFINGYFARVGAQTIILERYTTTPSYRVGLQISDSIVTESDDTSLLDPAQDSSNYQAPGSTRYKITLTLSKRSLSSTDDASFVELFRVINGAITQKISYPQLSELENTLARRTFDESGNYLVRPFQVALTSHASDTAQLNVVLEPGKAYVLGYEYETIAPTTLSIPRARTAANVTNYPLTVDYQNYVDVTRLRGPLTLDTLAPMTIHCVANSSINVTSAATAGATNMGTIRIRALDYQSGATSTSISTGVWRSYVLDANVSFRSANCGGTGTSTTIQLDSAAATQTDAYKGVKLRVATHLGTTYNELRQISAYNGSTKVATVTRAFDFGVPTTATIFSLDYEFKDAESFVLGDSNTITTSMDIDSASKLPLLTDAYQGSFITDTDFNRSILTLPNFAIGDASIVGGIPIASSEYYGRKQYTQSFSSNVITFTTTSGITSAVNGSPLSTTDAIDNILVVTTSAGTVANNQVINFASSSNTVTITTSSNTSTYTITVPNAGSQSAMVYVKVKLPYAHTLGNLRKSKQNKTANTTIVDTSASTAVDGANITWTKQGGSGSANGAQIFFSSSATGSLQTPNQTQSVYTADATRLAAIYDFDTMVPTTANIALATNITSRYTLDTGQRDNFYDHALIKLLPNMQGPKGNTVVYLDYFEHTGSGYLTVDSYIEGNTAYTAIPTYASPTTAETFFLRDCIDFRARRKNADVAGLFDEIILGVSGTNFETDFSYYLPRIDKVVLTKDRTFAVIQGISSLTPAAPADLENAMTLYTLGLPAYTANTSGIRVQQVDHRRFTMRDIGVLHKRLDKLEYYTALNQLEQAAKDQQIVDNETGLNRFKNGILVDSFKGHNIGDVSRTDYLCAIDMQQLAMRPPFLIQNHQLNLNTTGSTNYARNGSLITLPYVETTFVDQPMASQTININPFNVVSFIGQVQLDPASDNWIDTDQQPDVLVNMEGNNDAWAALARTVEREMPEMFGTVWDNWQTTWTGVSNVRDAIVQPAWRGGRGIPLFDNIIQQTLADVTQLQSRTGLETRFVPETLTRALGNRIVDMSIIPYIRPQGVLFIGKAFKPNTALYGFFDETSVQTYLNLPNIVELANTSVTYQDTYQDAETIRVYDPAIASNLATGLVVLSRTNANTTNVSIINVGAGDDANIANVRVVTANATFLIGNSTGANTRISGYHHYSGLVQSATSSTLTLSNENLSSNTASGLAGQTIYLTSGVGLGQSKVVSSYDVSTRVATFASNWTTTPTSNTNFSIGPLTTTDRGEFAGVFTIPSTTTTRFRTGERVLRFSDVNSTDLTNSTTNGDGRYFAQGLLQTAEQTILSTRTPTIQRTVLGGQQTVVTSVVQREQVVGRAVVGYYDPVAQTFLVDQSQFANGVQITSLRLVFKAKDARIPVQVQIRPVVNGYPHSSQVLPFADITLNADDVTVVSEATMQARFASTSLAKPLDDATLYTEVKFQGPVTLQAGQEYAIVLIANTVEYEVYLSEVGQTLLGTNRMISTQPYLGSFFKSQNSSTWTAIQEQDLMFRVMRANYDVVTGNVECTVAADDLPLANVPIDVAYVTTGNLILPNTTLAMQVQTTRTPTGEVDSYRPFDPHQNILFDDTLGRRTLTLNANSFKVRAYLSATTRDISPILDLERLSVLAIENKVNNLSLANASLIVVSSNTGYANASSISVSISGGGGSGANAYAVVTSNTVTSFIVDTSGSGYTSSPTVTVTGGGGATTAICVGEDQAQGGPALARYITRRVVLADDMDAGDLRVFLNAYKPTEANIQVYYKLLSSDDPSTFDEQAYQLMTAVQGYNQVSLSQSDLKEYGYAPGTSNVATNRISYGVYTNFKYFAIKIVLTTTNTTRAPFVKNLRVVAIPSLS